MPKRKIKKSKKKKINKKSQFKFPKLKLPKSKKKVKKKFFKFDTPKEKAEKLKKQKTSRKEQITFFKLMSTKFFGKTADKYCLRYFAHMKKPFSSANIHMMFRTYLCIMSMISVLTYFSALIFSLVFLLIFSSSLLQFLFGIIVYPILAGIGMFTFLYFYPTMKSNKRRTSIEANLPFAINHMSAVAASGASPSSLFAVLSKFKEYGEISSEAEKIVRDMELFGLDILSALRDVTSRSPSKEFKDFLDGLSTTIQTGGSLKKYLNVEAKEAMFNYRLNREKYTQTISIYADIYTALLIAAPLVLIAILAVLNVIGGTVFGLPTDLIIKVGIYVLIPLLNILFLSFLWMTQPVV